MITYWKIERLKTCVSPTIDSIVDQIILLMKLDDDQDRFRVPDQPYYLTNLKNHIKVILCNLISAEVTDPDVWISFLKGHEFYKKDPSKKGFQFSSRNINKVSDFLHKYGFIELMKGYPDDQWKGQTSKMKGLPKLFEFIGVPLSELVVFVDSTHLDVIRMKGKRIRKKIKRRDGTTRKTWARRPVKIPPRYNRKARVITANLREMNAVLDKALIDLNLDLHEFEELNKRLIANPDKYKKPIDLTNKYLYRVYHDSCFDQHGRFYGSWAMGIPEDYRKKIWIDGMPTVEFDFKSLHPAMLYCLEDLDIPTDDLYTLPEYPDDSSERYRKFFKMLMLTLINASSEDKAFGAVCLAWTKKKMKAKRQGKPIPAPPIPLKKVKILPVIKLLRDKHSKIEHYFDDGSIGNKLMNYDSHIAEQVMLHFAAQGIPVLPVHDSFIVPVDHADECVDVMTAAFKDLFGKDIPVDGSFIQAIKDAMKAAPVVKRSSRWNKMEAEITHESKVDCNTDESKMDFDNIRKRSTSTSG